MSRFKVYSKAKGEIIKVDAINPEVHLHPSSFTAFNFSLTNNGVRGEVPFSAKDLKSIQEQYGEDAVTSKSEKAEKETESPKKK